MFAALIHPEGRPGEPCTDADGEVLFYRRARRSLERATDPASRRRFAVRSLRVEEAIVRYVMDCREQPSENNCTLMIAGEREEVLKAAAEHAISSHGHTDSEELRSGLESAIKPEQTATAS